MPDDRAIDVGQLGRLHFHTGNYLYIGSAMAGLEARVARHLRAEKKLHWHIDHLLTRARVDGALLLPSAKREECSLSRTLHELPGTIAVGRFGSTDCSCPSHLFYIGKTPFGRMLRQLDRLGEIGSIPF